MPSSLERPVFLCLGGVEAVALRGGELDEWTQTAVGMHAHQAAVYRLAKVGVLRERAHQRTVMSVTMAELFCIELRSDRRKILFRFNGRSMILGTQICRSFGGG